MLLFVIKEVVSRGHIPQKHNQIELKSIYCLLPEELSETTSAELWLVLKFFLCNTIFGLPFSLIKFKQRFLINYKKSKHESNTNLLK